MVEALANTWNSPEGIAIAPFYVSDFKTKVNESLPGFAPYLRGPYAGMYVLQTQILRGQVEM